MVKLIERAAEKRAKKIVRVIERLDGCYEAQKMPFGTLYRWRADCVVIECECGERLTLTGSMTICGCGADHEATIREVLAGKRRSEDEALHPWRYATDSEDALPY